MASNKFNPTQVVDYQWMNKNLFDYTQEDKQMQSELNALLYVVADNKMGKKGLSAWNKKEDLVLADNDNLDYSIECEGVWLDEQGCFWVGKEMKIKVLIQKPDLYKLNLCFWDSNKQARRGRIECEDMPEYLLGDHEKATWVSLPITRENCLDGVVEVVIKHTAGPNLMLTKMALTKQ